MSPATTDQDKIIIGLTGSFGSGCSFIANNFICKKGYKLIVLSDILEELYTEEHQEPFRPLPRKNKQEYGNSIRQKHGPGFLAQKAYEKIEASEERKWVVDSIRNPFEVNFLKQKCSDFYLFSIYADFDRRWDRVKDIYEENLGEFKKDDRKDSNEILDYGQRVRDCYSIADIVISNNDSADNEKSDGHIGLKGKIDAYINLIEKLEPFSPTESEAIMAMAYANSLRSSCLKRQVGAIIIDIFGNVFSSGYNEVPIDHKSCIKKYGQCYRDKLKTQLIDEINNKVDTINLPEGVAFDKDPLKLEFQSGILSKVKNLERCRALHAEENAILNVARFGSSLAMRQATLYTTTYPCNLCANKIAQVGIKRLVYSEPYPMEEAKETLTKAEVDQDPFEGVSFKGYFRFMEIKP